MCSLLIQLDLTVTSSTVEWTKSLLKSASENVMITGSLLV